MSNDQHGGFELPGTSRPLPDEDLRKKREAVVIEHTIAEVAWDIDGVLATFPRGGVYKIIPFEEAPLVGEEAIKGYFADMRTSFPDLDHDVFSVSHTADAIVMEAQINGTQVADWRGIPNKGKRMSLPVAVFFHFDGDVLLDETIYYDHATAIRQLS
ncbi:ester cyclase [Streptomyces sp. NPDC021622]|uniref:ester cyclase n=1 Tax=unclassified Streptomyces TaxID=2593676 RepID=UPI0033F27ACF